LLLRKCRAWKAAQGDASVTLGSRSYSVEQANMKTVVNLGTFVWMAQNGYFLRDAPLTWLILVVRDAP
jgi:hypothetical protein